MNLASNIRKIRLSRAMKDPRNEMRYLSIKVPHMKGHLVSAQ